MKVRTKKILLVIGCICLLVTGGLGFLGYELFSANSALNRDSAINCVLTWGRLAPFPATAQQLTLSTEGSIFTRDFRASFIAPAADIEQWLQQSPGTRGSISYPSNGVRTFDITPGGGAQYAQVTVDDTIHRVSIHVYWS